MIINKNQTIFLISWTAVLFWMLIIFNLSSQVVDESNKLSTGVAEVIVETVEKVVPGYDLNIREFNHFLRKNAHFIAYLMLGILVMHALRGSGVKRVKAFVLAIGICFLYAVSDEVQQLFVPGRDGQAMDVLIDSIGSTVGVGVYLLILKTIEVNSKGDINGVTYNKTT